MPDFQINSLTPPVALTDDTGVFVQDFATNVTGRLELKKEIEALIAASTTLLDPSEITSATVELWLDASDLSTITEISGLISQWDDKSGNSRHAVQGISTLRPSTGLAAQNGKNVLQFTEVATSFLVTGEVNPALSTPVTMLIVGRTSSNYMIDGATSADRMQVRRDSSTSLRMWGGTTLATTASMESMSLIKAKFNGATSSLEVAGSATLGSAGTTEKFSGLTIGAATGGTSHGDSDIAEIVVISGTLSAADESGLIAGLKDKWGL